MIPYKALYLSCFKNGKNFVSALFKYRQNKTNILIFQHSLSFFWQTPNFIIQRKDKIKHLSILKTISSPILRLLMESQTKALILAIGHFICTNIYKFHNTNTTPMRWVMLETSNIILHLHQILARMHASTIFEWTNWIQ